MKGTKKLVILSAKSNISWNYIFFGGLMPSLVAFLTKLTIILSVTFVSLYVLATVFEPASREYRHEVLGLKIADE